MKNSQRWSILLGLAGVHDCGLALYHFILPYQMGWSQGLNGVPSSLVWALYALNFSWSLLLLLVGVLVLQTARNWPSSGFFARRMVFVVGLFWLIHGSYVWLNPFPLPPALQWLRYAAVFFPMIVIALHWLPLLQAEDLVPQSAL